MTVEEGWHKRRIKRLRVEVRVNLSKIRNLAVIAEKNPNLATPSQIYLKRQITKYLNPIGKINKFDITDGLDFEEGMKRLQQDLWKLSDCFTDAGDNGPIWSHYGFMSHGKNLKEKWQKKHLALTLGCAWAPIKKGSKEGDTIRIQQKAFLLPDKQLAGVLLHEATHISLATHDHKYALGSHSRMQDLNSDLKYKNADSWRIFYQKMRDYLGG